MKKSQPAIDLGTLQSNLESSSKELKLAQSNYLKAGDRLAAAQENNTNALISLNHGAQTLKSANYVPNLLAK